jgi:antirestriction protein ArdC
MSDQIRQQVTNRIHKALAEGLVPWARPWLGHRNDGPPTNTLTSLPFQSGMGLEELLLFLCREWPNSSDAIFVDADAADDLCHFYKLLS